MIGRSTNDDPSCDRLHRGCRRFHRVPSMADRAREGASGFCSTNGLPSTRSFRSVMGRHLGSGSIDEPAFYNFVRDCLAREVRIRTRSPDLSRRRDGKTSVAPTSETSSHSRFPKTEVQQSKQSRLARADRLSDFSKDFDELVAPYMNHHQKALQAVSWLKWLTPQSSGGERQLHSPLRKPPWPPRSAAPHHRHGLRGHVPIAVPPQSARRGRSDRFHTQRKSPARVLGSTAGQTSALWAGTN